MPDEELKLRPEFYDPLPRAEDEESDGVPYGVNSEIVSPVKEKPAPVALAPLAKSWDTLWPLATRRKFFFAMLTLNVVLLPVGWLLFGSLPASLSAVVLNSLLQAFLIGTFDRIDLVRKANGKVSLTRTWRVAFCQLQPTRIRWSEFESVGSRKIHEPHFEDWYVGLLLLLGGLIPGILWYWFVIRPERIEVIMFKDHGFPDTVLYRGVDESKVEEVAQTIMDVTGLPSQSATRTH
ncbi:MAG: hypothetical protein HY040_24185 [Planctomycetes bacterium]|nr:hypothetical protein [Planctomycetota bacterium]